MIGRMIMFEGHKYEIIDKVVMGNNPPTYYYILENEIGGIFKMAVEYQDRDWHFQKIEHWRLAKEGE